MAIFRTLFVLCGILCTALSLSAQNTWYVRADGNAGNNGQTAATAVRQIANIVGLADGDVIDIGAGDFAGANIAVSVFINGSNVGLPAFTNAATTLGEITLTGTDQQVTFDGVRFASGGGSVAVTGTGAVITITNSHFDGIGLTAQAPKVKELFVSNSVLDGNLTGNAQNAIVAEGIDVLSVRENTIRDHIKNAMIVSGATLKVTVAYNEFTNNNSENGNGQAAISYEGSSAADAEAEIVNNLFDANFNGVIATGGLTSKMVVRYNKFVSTPSGNLALWRISGSGSLVATCNNYGNSVPASTVRGLLLGSVTAIPYNYEGDDNNGGAIGFEPKTAQQCATDGPVKSSTTEGAGTSYFTISEAISASASGATVKVKNGSYNEDLSITKRLNIDAWPGGPSWAAISADTTADGRTRTSWVDLTGTITVSSLVDEVRLNGLHLIRKSSASASSVTLLTSNASKLTSLRNCWLDVASNSNTVASVPTNGALHNARAGDLTVQQCKITKPDASQLIKALTFAAGSGSRNVSIVNNDIEGTIQVSGLSTLSDVYIRNNNISNAGNDGISVTGNYARTLNVLWNTINASRWNGIAFKNGAAVGVNECNVKNNSITNSGDGTASYAAINIGSLTTGTNHAYSDNSFGAQNGSGLAFINSRSGFTAPATCNWWNNISEDVIVTRLGGAGTVGYDNGTAGWRSNGGNSVTGAGNNGYEPSTANCTVRAFTLALSKTNIGCNNANDGSITVTPTFASGDAAASYAWNSTPAQATATATGLSAGTYAVTVTSNSGNYRSLSAPIFNPTAITAVGTATDITCFAATDGIITISTPASGGTHTNATSRSYQYSVKQAGTSTVVAGPSTALSFTGLNAGTYDLYVTAAASSEGSTIAIPVTNPVCETKVQSSLVIIRPALLEASSTVTSVICGETKAAMTVTFTGGVGPYNIAWTGGGSATGVTSPYTITGLAVGTYTATVTDKNNCTASTNNSIIYTPVKNANTGLYYVTIQGAIDATATTTGNVIEVCAGTYTENITINKSLTLNGAKAGQATSGRLGDFISDRADATKESVIYPATSNTSAVAGNVVRILSSGVTFDGFTVDGSNPSLGSSGTTLGGLHLHARDGIANQLTASTAQATDNVIIRNNIVQNLARRGMTMNGASGSWSGRLSGVVVTANHVRRFVQRGISIAWNAYADVTYNTVSVDNTEANGIGFFEFTGDNSGGSASISNNTVTVNANSGIGIYGNFFNLPSSTFTIANNTVNAGNSLTAADNAVAYSWISSYQNHTATFTNNIAGSSGGTFARGFYFWNHGSTSTVSVNGGSVARSNNGVEYTGSHPVWGQNDGNFGTLGVISLTNMSISATSVGVLANLNLLGTAPSSGEPDAIRSPIRINVTDIQATAETQYKVTGSNPGGHTASIWFGTGNTGTNGVNGLVVEGPQAAIVGGAISNLAFTGQSGDYIKLINNTGNISAESASFDGKTGATATLAQNFDIEDKITHNLDNATTGGVRVKTSNIFVTPNSGSINRGIGAATGGDIVNVKAGTYTADVTLDKSITVLGPNGAVAYSGSRGAEAVIDGSVSITGSGSFLKGFEISRTTLPANTYLMDVTNKNVEVSNNVFKLAATTLSTKESLIRLNASTDGDVKFTSNSVTLASGSTVPASAMNAIGTSGAGEYYIYGNRFAVSGSNSDAYAIGIRGGDVRFESNIVNGNIKGGVLVDVTNINGNNSSDFSANGLELGDILIGLNDIDITSGTGLLVTGASNGTVIRVEDNNITGAASSTGINSSVPGSMLGILRNNVANNSTFVNHSGAGTLATDCMWFGTKKYQEIAPNIIGTVSYDSYNVSGLDDDPSVPGFQNSSVECIGTAVVITDTSVNNQFCSEKGSITVTYNSNVQTGGAGASLALSPYTISWTGQQTGSTAVGAVPGTPYTITGLNAGTYDVTVTDVNGSLATTNVTVNYFPVRNSQTGDLFSTIGAAIGAAATVDGHTIEICHGTFTENLSINKRLTLDGAGSGSDPASNTVITSAASGSPTISYSVGGTNATTRQILKDVRVTGASGGTGNNNSGILISGGSMGYFTFDNITATGNTGHGLVSNVSPAASTLTDVIITGSTFSSNGSAGLRTASHSVDGFTVSNSSFTNNTGLGLAFNSSDNTTAQIGGVSLTNVTFSGNNSVADLYAFRMLGNMSLTNVDFQGSNGSGLFGLYLLGGYVNQASAPAIGTVTLNDVSFTGTYTSAGLSFLGYSNLANVSMTDVVLNISNPTANRAHLRLSGVAGTLNLGNTAFVTPGSTPPALDILLNSNFGSVGSIATVQVDATNATFDGLTGSAMTLAQLFAREDRIRHAIDGATDATGFVRVKANEVFVTPNSYASPATTPSVQRGIDAATAGDVVNINDGTYTAQAITVNKRLDIKGQGTGTVLQNASNTVVTYAAAGSGTDATTRAYLRNVKLSGSTKGIYTQDLVNYLTLDGVTIDGNSSYGIHVNNTSGTMQDWVIQNSTFNANADGFRMGMGANINGLSITGSTFTSQVGSGIYIPQQSSSPGGCSNLLISNNTFTGNASSSANNGAVYIEKASSTTISGNTMTNNGPSTQPRGIAINLKYGSYSGITISGNEFIENRNGTQGNGSYAVNVAARNDASTYNSNPASLTTLAITSNKMTGFRLGVAVDNAVDWATTNVANNDIINCTTGISVGVYGTGNTANGVGKTLKANNNSITGSTVAVLNYNANGGTVDAECNWYGTKKAHVIAASLLGTVDYSPYLTSGTDGNAAVGFQPSGACDGTPVTVTLTNSVDLICAGTSTGSLDITASAGAPAYSYSWKRNNVAYATTEDLTGIPAGTYAVTVTDQNESEVTGSYVVTDRPVFATGTISSTGETICYAGTPAVEIGSTTPASGGNNTITYSWRSSADGYAAAITGATSATYTPPSGLTTTTSYRRYAVDGLCNTTPEVSTGTWTVTVRPQFSPGGIVTTGQTICSGGTPTIIGSATNASGGDNSITYSWRSSADGYTAAIVGATDGSYTPPAGPTVTTSYRRYATDATCTASPAQSDGTWTVTINDVAAGTISGDQTICEGGDPVAFTSSAAATGSGTITYLWQENTNLATPNWSNITSATTATYNQAPLTADAQYRRIATSTLNGVACTSVSNTVTVTVNNMTYGSIAGSQTICDGDDPVALTSLSAATGDGDISYQWQVNANLTTPNWTDISGATSATYDPGVLNADVQYRRMAISTLNGVACSGLSGNTVNITVNNMTAGSISASQTICDGGDPAAFTSEAATGDGTITYQWQRNTNLGEPSWSNISSATSETYDAPVLNADAQYRRVATSLLNTVTCSAISNVVTVTANNLLAGSISGNQTICEQGDPVAFTSTSAASGDGPITYQWQLNTNISTPSWSDISGATSETFDAGTLSADAQYRRVATSTVNSLACSAVSNTVTVTVNNLNVGSITGEQTICNGATPATIGNGTSATGDGTITYRWQSSVSAIDGDWDNIPLETAATYSPAGMSASMYFRRGATSTLSGVPCTKYTDAIKITVQAPVTAGVIAGAQTICNGGNPAAFTSTTDGTGSGTVTYRWESSTNGTDWSPIASETASTYDVPAGLTTTTQYRRTTISTQNSVACESAPSASVTITVQSAVTAGSIAGAQTICNGGNPVAFTSTTDGTGAGTISYRWESSTNGTDWSPIASQTASTYDVPAGLTTTTQYRRVTISTLNGNACESSPTAAVTVTVQSVPSAGVIAGAQTICNGGNPAAFTSTTDGTGSGTVTYRWESSTNGTDWTPIASETASTYDVPSGLTTTTQYRRTTISTQNSVACESSPSASVTVTVQAPVTAGAIAGAQTICNGGNPAAFTSTTDGTGSGTVTYRWESSTDGTDWSPIASETASTYDVPAGLTTTTQYRRTTISTLNGNACESAPTASVTVTVQSVPTAGVIAGAQTICNGGNPAAFTSTTNGTGSGTVTYRWESSTNGSTWSVITDETASTYDVPAGLTTTTQYRRTTISTQNGVACESTPTSSVTVTVQSVVTAGTIGASQTICYSGDPAAFTSTADGTGSGTTIAYRWESSTNGTDWTAISGVTSATYDAPSGLTTTTQYRRTTISTLNGVACESGTTAPVVVTVNPALSASIASQVNVSCNGGSNGTATAGQSGGTGPYTYSWTNGQTTNPATGLAAGTYSVTVTDDKGCTASATVTITQPPALVASIASQTAVSCFGGNNGTATAGQTGGTEPYTYLWTNSQTTQQATGLSAGTYSVTVTDSKNCTSEAIVTIVQPTAAVSIGSPSLTHVVCRNGATGAIDITVSGGTTPYSYTWTKQGADGTYATSEDLTGLTAGTYTVVVNDNNGSTGGCRATTTVEITQPATVVSLSSSTIKDVCAKGDETGSISITATGGTAPYGYTWTKSGTSGTFATTQNITGLAAGTYTVAVNDANGNAGGCAVTTEFVVLEPAVVLSASQAKTNITCSSATDGTITVSAPVGGWDSYQAQLYQTSPFVLISTKPVSSSTPAVFSDLAPGTYTVGVLTTKDAVGNRISVACGRLNDENITILRPSQLAIGTISTTNTTCGVVDGTVVLASPSGGTHAELSNPTYEYLLNNSDNSITRGPQTSLSFTGLAAGTYTVTIRAKDVSPTCERQYTGVVVEGPTTLSATVTKVNVQRNDGSNGSIMVSSPAGGTTATVLARSYRYSIMNVGSSVVTGPQTSNQFTGLAAGTYEVTLIADAVGNTPECSSMISTQTILLPSAVTGTSVKTNIVCNGSSTGTITASGAAGGTHADATTRSYTYRAARNGGGYDVTNATGSFTGLGAGTYSISVLTSAEGGGVTPASETTVSSQVILLPSAVTASVAKTNISCNGNTDGTITASNAAGGIHDDAGSRNYTYRAQSSGVGYDQTNATGLFTGLSAGTYTVSVIAAAEGAGVTPACTTVVSSQVIYEPSVVTSTDISGVSTKQNITCAGETDGSITFNTISGGTHTDATTRSYTYRAVRSTGGYDQTNATGSFTGLSAGTYNLSVISAEEGSGVTPVCTTAVASQVINEPTTVTASVAKTNITCNGSINGTITVSSTAGGIHADAGSRTYQYMIARSGGATTGPQTSGTFTGLQAGSYSVSVVAQATGSTPSCTTVVNPQVVIFEPRAIGATVAKMNISCNGSPDGTITVSGTSGGTHLDAPTRQYSYRINSGAFNQTNATGSFTGLSAGTYLVLVNAASEGAGVTPACSDILVSTQVILEPTVVASSGTITTTNQTCASTLDATINLIGATGGIHSEAGSRDYRYSITKLGPGGTTVGPQTSASFTGLAAGTYDLYISTLATGFSPACTTLIGQRVLTAPTAVTYTITDNADTTAPYVKLGGTVTFTLKVQGGTPKTHASPSTVEPHYTITWSGSNPAVPTFVSSVGATNGEYTITYEITGVTPDVHTGSYGVTVNDGNGCASSDGAKSTSVNVYSTVSLYVDNVNGSKTTGTGTTQRPLYSITKAIDIAANADEIYVMQNESGAGFSPYDESDYGPVITKPLTFRRVTYTYSAPTYSSITASTLTPTFAGSKSFVLGTSAVTFTGFTPSALYVNNSGTIQVAIDAVTTGGAVTLLGGSGGTYNLGTSKLLISKALTLRGVGSSDIQGDCDFAPAAQLSINSGVKMMEFSGTGAKTVANLDLTVGKVGTIDGKYFDVVGSGNVDALNIIYRYDDDGIAGTAPVRLFGIQNTDRSLGVRNDVAQLVDDLADNATGGTGRVTFGTQGPLPWTNLEVGWKAEDASISVTGTGVQQVHPMVGTLQIRPVSTAGRPTWRSAASTQNMGGRACMEFDGAASPNGDFLSATVTNSIVSGSAKSVFVAFRTHNADIAENALQVVYKHGDDKTGVSIVMVGTSSTTTESVRLSIYDLAGGVQRTVTRDFEGLAQNSVYIAQIYFDGSSADKRVGMAVDGNSGQMTVKGGGTEVKVGSADFDVTTLQAPATYLAASNISVGARNGSLRFGTGTTAGTTATADFNNQAGASMFFGNGTNDSRAAVGEILIYNTASQTTRNAVYCYLRNKFMSGNTVDNGLEKSDPSDNVIAGDVDVTDEITVYPNPAESDLNVGVVVREAGRIRVDVVDALGRVVYQALDEHSDGNSIYPINVDVSKFANGTYAIRVIGANNLDLSKTFIVRH
ncbi:MAG: T9SS type A sorting domain-containing protein [Candidatus Kapabacteria bacterium]|nr:T9SS type A sorting domain-containing protein [Candidatus Kapabacteria bacterium]